VGESGSGKSLTTSAVLGLLPEGVQVRSGQILWRRQDLLQLSAEGLRKLRGSEIGDDLPGR
jgi:peptide/nickel transport system ATP-binding protein